MSRVSGLPKTWANSLPLSISLFLKEFILLLRLHRCHIGPVVLARSPIPPVIDVTQKGIIPTPRSSERLLALLPRRQHLPFSLMRFFEDRYFLAR